ncbi:MULTISPECIES: hypothetical protein [Nocardia]|uniref:hypothetical protein n=1 Tax=Nocardia TaxID=1817 RepID=UPI00265AC0AC|nr:hypothetical protein [Nocardia sp. PE-7]WKG10790.1 hypothetical protein QX204_04665 [Nocardia sp. PE-7]
MNSPAVSMPRPLLDFSLLTGTAILLDQSAYLGTMLPVLVYPILAVVLLLERNAIEPAAQAPNP